MGIKLKFPIFGFLSSPYFTRDASCVMLNIDWTPLSSARVRYISAAFTASAKYRLHIWQIGTSNGGVASE